MSEKISRAVFLEGRELLKRLQARFPVLFPADRRDLKPWAVGEGARMRQALADAEDGETVSTEVWRAAMGRWFHADLKRRVAYLKCDRRGTALRHARERVGDSKRGGSGVCGSEARLWTGATGRA